MFLQISPSEQDLSETLSSLNFATRVRGVELGPAKKQIDAGELQNMKMMLDKARQESKSKDESLRKLEENLQNLENKARGKDHIYKSQQEKIMELEGHLELKSNLYSQSEKQVSQLSDKLKGREEICNSLQNKVKEMENKLRERQQSDSAAFQQKNRELENKLKEQVQESESHSLTLQHKVRELENKLKEQVQESESHSLTLQYKIVELERKMEEQEQNSEALLLQKIQEQEDKLREQEKQLQSVQAHDFLGIIKATPNEGKTSTRDEKFLIEIESHVLRSSNSIKLPLRRGSALPKSNDTLHDTRKKRQSRSGEVENNVLPASFHDSRSRKSDPPKIAGVMRTTKAVSATAAQGTLNLKRIIRDQGQGIRERDGKKKIWSR